MAQQTVTVSFSCCVHSSNPDVEELAEIDADKSKKRSFNFWRLVA